ncbi:MAG: TIGR01458 family HAD-type hydrolase [Agarilytica sp.]
MKGILIDLDGAIFQGEHLMPGAEALIRKLQSEQFPHLFLTNSSARPRQAIVDKLSRLGLTVTPQEILTPAVAAAQWLCEHSIERLALLLPRDTTEDLVGFEIVSLAGRAQPEAIIIGDLGENWSYNKLNFAFRHLMESPPPKLIALGMTRYWRSPEGLNLDVAPFIKALEFASGAQAEVVGKPSPTYFEECLHILDCKAEDCGMVGDDIYADVKGAQDAGLKGILVRSGKFREQDLQSGVTPDHVLDTVVDIDRLLDW